MRFYVRCCAVVLCLVEPAERADLWLGHQVLEQRKVSVLGADVEGTTASTSLEGRRDHSFDGRFGPLRNRPPVLWCRFPGSRPKRRHSTAPTASTEALRLPPLSNRDPWRQDGENGE